MVRWRAHGWKNDLIDSVAILRATCTRRGRNEALRGQWASTRFINQRISRSAIVLRPGYRPPRYPSPAPN